MTGRLSRRTFLRTATAVGVGEFAGLLPFGPAKAADAAVTPDVVRVSPDTEPVIRLIADTPAEKCLPAVMDQLRRGLPYRHLLAGLYLTAVRAGSWYAAGPFDHIAYVVHSAHQLTLDLPPQEALLPVFWALASLKSGSPKPAALPIKLGGPPPAVDRAADELRAGIEGRDEDRAARAVVALARHHGAARVGEALWPFAGRDWTFIGHLAILVSNSWRLLQTIGWQHAEPVLRYVASGLAGGKKDPADLAYFAENAARVDRTLKSLPADWAGDGEEPVLTRELLALIRDRQADQAADLVVARLAAGTAKAGAVWDAVFLAAGEMIRAAQKNSTPLHSNTVANALRFAFGESGEPRTRLLILLQTVAWTVRFRAAMANSGWLREATDITSLSAAEADADRTAAEILATLSHGGLDHGPANISPVPGWHGLQYNNQPWRHAAAQKAFALARRDGGAEALFRTAARLLPAKADTDPHRIKFAVAMFENYRWVSPRWRPHLAAAAVYSFLGQDAPDTATIRQVRDVMGRS
jgi:hypothetical protein